MNKEVNLRIRKYRKKANLNQAQVADGLGMKHSTYSQMERSGKIKAELIEPIAKVLKVDPVILLFGEQEDIKISLPPVLHTPEPVVKQAPPPIFTDGASDILPLKNREVQAIKIIRNLPAEQSEEIFKFIHEKHLKNNKK